MLKLSNSCSLTEFQRNAKTFINELNAEKNPMMITVNGKIQAVVVDPETFEDLARLRERSEFIEAIRQGERDMSEGRVHTLQDVIRELQTKYGL